MILNQFVRARYVFRFTVITGALLLGQQYAWADCDYFKDRTIRWIIPWSVGGGYDTYSRMIGPAYSKRLGAEVRFINEPGAGGRVGANKIKHARPDGLTVGILNATGLAAYSLSGAQDAVDLSDDFTVIARVNHHAHVWATGAKSGIHSIEQLWERDGEPPVFGAAGAGSASFIVAALTAHILQLKPVFVSGYKGSRQSKLAAIRGDVDLVSHSDSSMRKPIVAGELVPLLVIGRPSRLTQTSLKDIPRFDGEQGVAAVRARVLGRDVSATVADADAVIRLLAIGRLVVGPRGVKQDLVRCMVDAMSGALHDPDVEKTLASVGRSLTPARPDAVITELETLVARAGRLKPAIQSAIAQLRE